ncbi:MAG TPA: IclR family transcriptional regulator [Paracoccus sp. (in: a-proteobacteria)]|uniref:IclR family transcriptional regulator n=1 Tax=Paracoccus sp. TaxID=267 RepID=UPI002C42AF7E|nr:IclR family transcriptional regulator [Paracoccus sp. (in: a-proteobacteria)]HWL55456.1 IclR family transcriptional regulator [Paracoccus sp. (in: a-proteobacteria)]
MEELDHRLFVSSASKAIRVLEVVASKRGGMTLGEVARETGLGMSAAQRFTYTLHKLGYLDRDSRHRSFSIAPKILRLGMFYLHGNELVSTAEGRLIQLAQECNESVNLVILDNIHALYIWHRPCRELVSVNIPAGTRLPAYCTASGRAILSQLPDAQLRQILDNTPIDQRTATTVTALPDILARIEEVRRTQVSLSNQECFEGAMSIASPIRDERAAISISLPISRKPDAAALKALSRRLLQTAREIAEDLDVLHNR